MDTFELTDDDVSMISIAIHTVRRFLTNPQLTGQEVIGLGNALYALERLPDVTPGASSEFGVVHRNTNENSLWASDISFLISDSTFAVSISDRSIDVELGSDRYVDPGWLVELGGYRKANPSLLLNLYDDITEYLNSGAKITVSDYSKIDYEWSGYRSRSQQTAAELPCVVKRKAVFSDIKKPTTEL